jgi:hypothetical protein
MSAETKGRITLTISTTLTKEQANEVYTAMVAGDMSVLGNVLDNSTKQWTDLMVIGDSLKGLVTDTPMFHIFVADEKMPVPSNPRENRPMGR